MKRLLLAMATLCSAALVLTGCTSPKPNPPGGDSGENAGATTQPPHTENHGCIASFKSPAGDLKGAGFEIPLGKWAGGPIKIGSIEYSHAQAQKLSEAASLAEQGRLEFCRATDPEVISLIPAADRAEVIMTAITGQRALKNKVDAFVKTVTAATDPQQVVAAAEELAKDAKEAKKQFAEKVPATQDKQKDKQANLSPGEPLPFWAALTLMQANTIDGFRQLSDKVDVVNQRLDAKSGQGKIRVTGFNDSGVSLPASERQQLYSQFEEALGKIPKTQRPMVLIVGYANKSGSPLRNINIGLRRAQTVMNYLQEQKFSRSYEGHVMSGGIDDSAYAHRVDVFVTGA